MPLNLASGAGDLRRAIARCLDEPDLLDRLRAGIGDVRSIDDDIAAATAMYEASILSRFSMAGEAAGGRRMGRGRGVE